MQGGSAEGWDRISPSAMNGSSAKKARFQEVPNGHVKREAVAQEAAAGEGGIVAAENGLRAELAVRIDMRVLHCPLCSRPFKPPVLQCNGGHLVCGACVAALPGGLCETCEDDDGVFAPCRALETVLSAPRVACLHDGCGRFVVYHEAGEHKDACAHAPCHCTEPGYGGFEGSPAALAGHLASVHAVPVRNVRYGKVTLLHVPASVPRLLLVAAEDDGRVFLLTAVRLGSAAAVSVVCVRASAAPRPRFTCKMCAVGGRWQVRRGPGGDADAEQHLARRGGRRRGADVPDGATHVHGSRSRRAAVHGGGSQPAHRQGLPLVSP